MSKPWKRERHLYQFDCIHCGKSDAQSLKKGRARLRVCRKCARATPNPDQMTVFDTPCTEGGIRHGGPGCAH